MEEHEIKRTIDEVIDVESGEVIKSIDFFKRPEAEIIAYRRRLQEAIAGFEQPKFKCAYCNQLLKLSGKSTIRGHVSFFAHQYDSEDCEIKTSGDLSKEEIEARKYGYIGESERHKRLKKKLADFLKSTPNISNVEIEKRITSDYPFLYWRRPDVHAEYDNKNIVFELQLSTTFLSVVIDRDIFYRVNNTFIVWVFNFSDNEEYVTLQNLMCKDIYYANKRNAFVFDENAQRLSEENGELHLLCIWFEPIIDSGFNNPNDVIKKEEYIKFSNLKFDEETFKPYYIDADIMFSKYQPNYFETKLDLENAHRIRLDKIARKQREKERIQKIKEIKIEEIKELIKQDDVKLQPFEKSKKWGYKAGDIEIIEAKYSEATNFSSCGFAKIKHNKKYGFINNFGDLLFECIFIEAFNIFNNKCVVKYEKSWYILNLSHGSKTAIDCFDIKKLTENLLEITKKDINKVFSSSNSWRENSYTHNDIYGVASMDGNEINNCFFYKIYDLKEGRLKSKINEYCLSFNEDNEGLEIAKEDVNFIKNCRFGIVDSELNTIIPFEFDLIEDFYDGRAKAKKGEKFGYIDEQGQTIIPFEFDLIEDFYDGRAKAKKWGRFGYIDEQGQTLIPFKYKWIEDFIDGRAKAKCYGIGGIKYIDEQGQCFTPLGYVWIDDFIDGLAKCKKFLSNEGIGCINKKGMTIIPFEYNLIEDFKDGRAIAKKGGKFGYIDIKGNVLIPFEYESIEDLKFGKAHARKVGEFALIDSNGNGFYIFKENKTFKGKYEETIIEQYYGIKDTNGKIIVNPIYNKIEDFDNGMAKVYKDKKYIGGDKSSPKFKYKVGYINEIGETIIPCIYDEIFEVVNGKAKVKKDGNHLLIDVNPNKNKQSKIDFNFYKIGSIHKGKICQIENYGLFIEFEDGITSLLHISALKKQNKVCEDYNIGVELIVVVLSIDEGKNRISLTL